MEIVLICTKYILNKTLKFAYIQNDGHRPSWIFNFWQTYFNTLIPVEWLFSRFNA